MPMSTVVSQEPTAYSNSAATPGTQANPRAQALAATLEQGAQALAAFASTLTDGEWGTPVPKDGRPIGVVIHHVASVYPIEIHLAQMIALGQAIEGVTNEDVNAMNAAHAKEHAAPEKRETLDVLRRNSATAAAAIRALGDDALDRTLPASLYDNAPVTCQFVLEDHAVRHSYHHLAIIRKMLNR